MRICRRVIRSVTSAFIAAALAGCTLNFGDDYSLDASTFTAEHIQTVERVSRLKSMLRQCRIPYIDAPTHIIPVMIGDPNIAREASEILMDEYSIFVQHINYPTVAKGTERLRITPTPLHSDEMMDCLNKQDVHLIVL